jgi:hypothetical protein
LRNQKPILEALGFLDPELEKRKQQFAILEEQSERGRARRRQLAESMDFTCHEFQAHGSDMGQRYKSPAVFLEGAGDPPALPSNPTLYHEPHTFPGLRLPHAWLNTSIPKLQVSTIDLAGKGRFALFTGHGGEAWRAAGKKVTQVLGVEVAVYAVGYKLEYEAVYNDWYRLREVEEDGCVLVRPDNFVAWRSQTATKDCGADLLAVFRHILAL